MKHAYLAFIIGVLLGSAVVACATNPFPYNYYGVDLKDQKLLGPSSGAYPDLPLATCDATAVSASPCVGMLTTTLETLKVNYEDLQDQLIACQKQLVTQ
jgi:hypothetical protein